MEGLLSYLGEHLDGLIVLTNLILVHATYTDAHTNYFARIYRFVISLRVTRYRVYRVVADKANDAKDLAEDDLARVRKALRLVLAEVVTDEARIETD